MTGGGEPLRGGSTTTTSTIYFVYDEAGKLMGEYKPDGTTIREYIWLDDTLVAMRAGYASHKFQYVLTDHLNTPRAVVLPSTNAIIWRWDLTTSAFGDHTAQNNPDGDGTNYMFNLRYPGQYFDSETGLHYNYFRDYEPGTGRYVQSDPIGLSGGVSTFAYGGSDPVSNFDPRGQYCVSHKGDTLCHYPGGPMFIVPTPENFPEHINARGLKNLMLYHRYDVTRDLGCKSPSDVLGSLLNSPTPEDWASSRPATPEGTANNAAVAPFMNNPVTSYRTNDLITGESIAVNIAGAAGVFGPGYVARAVRGGTAHTYGEGLAPIQSPVLTLGPLPNFMANELVWGRQMSSMIDAAGNTCGCQ